MAADAGRALLHERFINAELRFLVTLAADFHARECGWVVVA